MKIDQRSNFNFDTGSFTISCWGKRLGNNSWQHLVSRIEDKNYPVKSSFFLRFEKVGIGSHLGGHGDTGNGAINISNSNSSFNFSNWNHLAMTFDDYSNVLKLYVNGKLISFLKITYPRSFSTSGNLFFGVQQPIKSMPSGPNYFTGTLDEVGIWSRALDSNEINNLYVGCVPQKNRKSLSAADTLIVCSTLKLTSKNKSQSKYLWSNGDTTISTTINNSGLVILTETDTLGCKVKDSVYVRVVKDEISIASDTVICGLRLNDTLKLNLGKWFNSSKFYFFDVHKSQVSTTSIHINNGKSKYWSGFVTPKASSSLKCPVSGKIEINKCKVNANCNIVKSRNGLIRYYKFDNNYSDSSGNSSHVSGYNGIQFVNNECNQISRSAYFGGDSIQSYIRTPQAATVPTDFTYSLKFKTKKKGYDLLNYRSSFNGSGNWDRSILMDSSGRIEFFVFPGTPKSIISKNKFGDDKWHQVFATLSSVNGMSLYIDGNLEATDPNVKSAQNFLGYWLIGFHGHSLGSGHYKGYLDEVAIWNRALDTTEIKAFYSENCIPLEHNKLSSEDTILGCSEVKLKSKNKKYVKYIWSNGDSATSSIIGQTGLVTLTELDSFGCKNKDSVFINLINNKVSIAPDTTICGVKLMDSMQLDLSKWFNNEDYYFYDKQKNQSEYANFFVKNNKRLKWVGFVSDKNNSTLKCPVSGNIYPSVVYPRLVNKLTDTILTTKSALKPSVVDKKYTHYTWSNNDTTWTTNFTNSGNYWFKQMDSVGCSQTDTFHFSRINLTIPSKITAKFGSKILLKVKDSLNASSYVVWSTGDTSWHTIYTVTKNTDTIFATQQDAYRSVTKFTVITGRLEPIRTIEEYDNFDNDSAGNTKSQNNTAGIEVSNLINLRIYPNPVGTEITLEGLTHPMNYEIHTVTGQLVQSGKTSTKINVETLESGIYILKLENVSVKFVKE